MQENPVRISRLSEIDLARLAALTDQRELEHQLRAYNAGGGAWSYDPVRRSTLDILGAATSLFGTLPPVEWPKIARQIAADCRRGPLQIAANTLVGKILFERARGERWLAAEVSMGAMPIGIGETVRYWSNVVLQDAHGPFVPYFDHRREHGIANAAMRQVVFSMQHIWVRQRQPDLADVRLAIVRFPSIGTDRSTRIDFLREADLLPYDVLDARVRNVYETWAKVTAEKSRRSGTGGGADELF